MTDTTTPGYLIAKGYDIRQDTGPRTAGRHVAYCGPRHTPDTEYPMGCKLEDEANARRIANTWNCHEDLLEALEPLANLDLHAGEFDKMPDDQIVYERNNSRITCGDVRRARAAIAKAKGEVQ